MESALKLNLLASPGIVEPHLLSDRETGSGKKRDLIKFLEKLQRILNLAVFFHAMPLALWGPKVSPLPV
jgi:hypothetical protein